MGNWIRSIIERPDRYLIPVLLVIAVASHGMNMFHYPYYEDDEGTYVSQAWSLATFGKMAPYTYTYDHAPGGWILLALWSGVTGGFSTFGFSINSGRALMLLVQAISVVLLYISVKRLTGNAFAAACAALVFSLSPLGIYYHRRVLLDNMMVLWILISLAGVATVRGQDNTVSVLRMAVSGLAFGIAVTTKETAVFLWPGFIYLILTGPATRRKIGIWLLFMVLPGLAYIGYAALRGELIPYGMPGGGAYPHVSLIGTWIEQFRRPLVPGMFMQSLATWMRLDPLIMIAGVTVTLINAAIGIRRPANRIAAVLSVLFILYLVRGGVVLEFYIIPAIMLFALNIGVLAGTGTIRPGTLAGAMTAVGSMRILTAVAVIMALDLLVFGSRSKDGWNLMTADQTTPQVQAVDFVLSRATPGAVYVIDNYAYVDLHTRGAGHFRLAEYYWKIDRDPSIAGLIGNDWRNVTTLIVTPQMKTDVAGNDLPITKNALSNSRQVSRFENDGWNVEVRDVTP